MDHRYIYLSHNHLYNGLFIFQVTISNDTYIAMNYYQCIILYIDPTAMQLRTPHIYKIFYINPSRIHRATIPTIL